MANQEHILGVQVTNFLATNYPDVPFHHDFGTGTKLTLGQAVKQRQLNPERGWPDLFIAEARGGYNGLFIELKAKDIYKKNGDLRKDDHLAEQAAMLGRLQAQGYRAVFCVGLPATKAAIEEYLGIRNKLDKNNVF